MHLTPRSVSLLAALIALAALLAPAGAEAALLAHWVEYGSDGTAEARVAIDGPACPLLAVDGRNLPMAERSPPDEDFPVRICAAALPPGAGEASVLGAALPLPHAAPARILVLGDTGCRIKGVIAQGCNDPAKWPFPGLAAKAAALRPDLVIHVGDYLYRESPCPPLLADCTGSPWGDNWATWQADFLTPAAPLLAVAPWIAVRGNHEICGRAGHGWTRLLAPEAPRQGASCIAHHAPFAVRGDGIAFLVMDAAAAPDTSADERLVPLLRGEIASLAGLARGPSWLLMHRPIRGIVRFLPGMVGGGNRTLLAASADGLPTGVELMLAGHIHAFEAINYATGSPPQLVVGNGGDRLDAAPADLAGITVGGLVVKDGLTLPGFGFVMMTREVGGGWKIAAYDAAGGLLRRCTFADRRIACPST